MFLFIQCCGYTLGQIYTCHCCWPMISESVMTVILWLLSMRFVLVLVDAGRTRAAVCTPRPATAPAPAPRPARRPSAPSPTTSSCGARPSPRPHVPSSTRVKTPRRPAPRPTRDGHSRRRHDLYTAAPPVADMPGRGMPYCHCVM